MPYATIYLHGGKWHAKPGIRDEARRRIGAGGEQPPREEMCEKCFPYLFSDPDVCVKCGSRNTNDLSPGEHECYDCGVTYRPAKEEE